MAIAVKVCMLFLFFNYFGFVLQLESGRNCAANKGEEVRIIENVICELFDTNENLMVNATCFITLIQCNIMQNAR